MTPPYVHLLRRLLFTAAVNAPMMLIIWLLLFYPNVHMTQSELNCSFRALKSIHVITVITAGLNHSHSSTPVSHLTVCLIKSQVCLKTFFFLFLRLCSAAGGGDRLLFRICEERLPSLWVLLPLPPLHSAHTVFRRSWTVGSCWAGEQTKLTHSLIAVNVRSNSRRHVTHGSIKMSMGGASVIKEVSIYYTLWPCDSRCKVFLTKDFWEILISYSKILHYLFIIIMFMCLFKVNIFVNARVWKSV